MDLLVRLGADKMRKNGFTLPELLVSMGIVLILWAIASVSLVRTQTVNTLDVTTDLLISDIKSQQTKAFSGESDSSLGIYFETHQYTLFTGDTFSPSDPTNFVVSVEDPIGIENINVPNSSIVFSKGSGEVSGFVTGQSIRVSDSISGKGYTLNLSKYGAITRN